MSDLGLRATSALGFAVFIGVAYLLSSSKRDVPWRTVVWGVVLQFGIAIPLLKTDAGREFFVGVNAVATNLLSYTDSGTQFVFGSLAETGFSFALGVLPVIVFMGALFGVLYHLGIVQRVVDLMAAGLARTMKLSGAESLAAVANIFVGMVESGLIVKPYLPHMTRSELFSLMTLGMATVAGSVLLTYVSILGGGDFAGHLVAASLISAPAGLLIAKVMVPETEDPETGVHARAHVERDTVNVIDGAATGAINGLRLAVYVGAMLLAFVAMISLMNDLLAWSGSWVGLPDLSFQRVLGWLLAPVAFLMGIPWEDAQTVGSLLGLKTVINEFVAYQALGGHIADGTISARAALIASYALCGFANFGSLAILLGGIGGMAPERRPEVATLGMRSIVGGTLATMMTGCVAGVLI